MTPAEATVVLVIYCVGFLTALVILAAPIEYAAKRSPRFADWLDRLVDRVFP